MKRLQTAPQFVTRFRFSLGVAILNTCWIGGLILGMLIAGRMREVLIPLVRSVSVQPAGISGLMVASVLPCLLCAYGVTLGELWVLPLVGGMKAFAFGFCGCGISLTFGQSGWLMRLLLLFSDSLILVPLYLFSLRHICGRTSRVRRDLAILLPFSAGVCLVDYGLISPFLCKLFS